MYYLIHTLYDTPFVAIIDGNNNCFLNFWFSATFSSKLNKWDTERIYRKVNNQGSYNSVMSWTNVLHYWSFIQRSTAPGFIWFIYRYYPGYRNLKNTSSGWYWLHPTQNLSNVLLTNHVWDVRTYVNNWRSISIWNEWAKVIPLYKYDNFMSLNNYRPYRSYRRVLKSWKHNAH